MTVVAMDDLGDELNRILRNLEKKNKELVVKRVAALPSRFEERSLRFYMSVLKVRSGRLRQSFQNFLRKQGGGRFILGLRSDVEYAAIQHYGGKTPPHDIFPRRKKALYWPGARHPVKHVKHPGSNIRAKHFFSKPMQDVTNEFLTELKRDIGW